MYAPKVIELMVDVLPAGDPGAFLGALGLCDAGGKSEICTDTKNPCIPPTKPPNCDPGTKTSICQGKTDGPCVPPTRLPQCKPGSKSTVCNSKSVDPVDLAGLTQGRPEPLDAATALLLLKTRLRDELAQRAILS